MTLRNSPIGAKNYAITISRPAQSAKSHPPNENNSMYLAVFSWKNRRGGTDWYWILSL